MNTFRISAALFLLLVAATNFAIEARSSGGGTLGKNVLFDGNVAPPAARHSNWHENIGKAVVDARPVALNLRALRFPDAGRIPAEKMPPTGLVVGHTFDLILPGDTQPIALEVHKVEKVVEGVVTYSGALAGDSEAVFSFSVQNQNLLGRILIGDAVVILRPSGVEGVHDMIIIDRALLPADDDTVPSESEVDFGSSVETFSTTGMSSNGSGDVRTLFLFANNVGNQSLTTAAIVSEFNNALSRSGVASNNKLSSAGIITVASGFTGSFDCKGKILWDMHKRNFPFSDIDQWMSQSAADIAFLVVRFESGNIACPSFHPLGAASGRVGGIATGFYPGDSTIQDPSASPFSLSSDLYVFGDLTALHEIGHTLGGRHANTTGPEEMGFANGELAHGFDNDNAGEWQSIMGGYRGAERDSETGEILQPDRCKFDSSILDPVDQPCERIPYFSNPSKSATINGQSVPALGTTTITDFAETNLNDQFKADMETWLETSGMPIVSGYFQDPPPPAAAPVLDVIPGFCFGSSSVHWTAVSGASNYRLFRSFSSGFSSPTLIFDGSGTSAYINIPDPPEPGTWYLRVKACNSGGCSGWSNQESAFWVNGCF